MYRVRYAAGVLGDLRSLRPMNRATVLDAIDEQLPHEPAVPTRNRKMLHGLVPPWDHVPPVWELRVGTYRVFYDVDEVEQIVTVRAVRRKPSHRSTEDIL